ncbi:DgyrCDS1895 [Dimorphilus gyrociliatus]|uniref:DgyrCDS1895 n=1 Tax=Dimorphilus gyrociliatus TaxID=2664684 RepID=A0A7I8V8W5_9ANNE|nr:DgyrCDS1895 [Dimorphilus gyrociliatus]
MSSDEELQDFFAKKDKTKIKKKAKTKTGKESVDSPVDNSGKSKVKKAKKKEKEKAPETESKSEKKDDEEEWIDFETPAEVDLSGLRINTQLTQQVEEESKDIETEEERAEKDKEEGPWKPVTQTAKPPTPEPVVPEVEPTPKQEETEQKYVPPQKRSTSDNRPLAPVVLGKWKKSAPNIKSEEDFPTLGAIVPSDISGGNFENVQRGGRYMDTSKSTVPTLEVGNKYGALAD